MRIKIPYNLLDRFSQIEFVAFILERGGEQVCRIDLTRGQHLDFFIQKQKHVVISDDLYNEADTFIFYPYYKQDGWFNKLVLRKDVNKFIRASGSEYLIKNNKKQGNLALAKEWIYKGTQIPIDDNIVGKKNLIYFTLFGDTSYVKLLRALVATLKKQKYKNFDLLFITDKSTAPLIKKIRDLKQFNVDYHIIKNDIKDPVTSSMQKLKIYDYKNIDQYSKILFLDCDILVIGDLSKIFDEKTRANVFYSGLQRFSHGIHRIPFHRLLEYNEKELQRFEKNNIFPFNAGQFFFLNTASMKKHFENINEFVAKWDGEYFFEQSFLNCYFNVLSMSNVFKFKDQFCFVSINEHETQNKFNPDAVVVHFMGSTAEGSDKMLFIKTYYSHLM